nr:general transcription factor 3C polypeptide 2-like isoform X1 [Ciona intestinalis]XP_026694461.1 general transcription factor 3C polypeptide 2-like isoform X1 [Ciona intestinalis]|eukprot:XP_018671315.1 general transcription factor 3C polypeptide 2-like isoform X1 [Ciona intestinalis]
MPSRRKNTAPQRLPALQDEEIEEAWPTDPALLAQYITEHPLTEFYSAPSLPKFFMEQLQDAKKTSKEEGIEIYHCKACNNKKYKTLSGLRYHVQQSCDQVPRRAYTCLLCTFQHQEERNIEYHIQEHHVEKYLPPKNDEKYQRRASKLGRMKVLLYEESSSAADVIDKEAGSEYEEEETVEEETVEEFEGEEEDEILSNIKVKTATKSTRTPRKSRRKVTPKISRLTYTTLGKPLSNAFGWTYSKRRMLEKKFPHVFPNWTAQFTLGDLDTTEDISNFGLRKTSPAFAIDRNTLNKISAPKNSNDSSLEFKKLNCFASVVNDGIQSATMFTGGPVWSMAWCPFPCDVTSHQYLALSTNIGEHYMDPKFTYKDRAMIQIWDCGEMPLKLKKKTSMTHPCFSLGLTLDVGPIWDMKWCPYGGHVSSTLTGGRLGLLAVACASGDVYIISIPHLQGRDQILNGNTVNGNTGKHPIFKTRPVIKLCPVRGESRPFGQTFSLTWSTNDGCGFVAAGFASGHVAVWDLRSASSLLLGEVDEYTKVLYACHSFRAHNKPLRGIVWCPFDSNILVTGGNDRMLKLWDRRRTDAPLHENNVTKCSFTSEMEWPINYNGIYTATNNAFSIPHFHSCLYVKLNVQSDALPPINNVFPNKATSWTVTSSDWLNCVGGGDVTGLAMIHISNNWNRGNIYVKKVSRMLLFQCDVIDDEVTSQEVTDNESKDGEDYKLVFRDADTNTDLSKANKLESYKRLRTYDCFKDDNFKPNYPAILKMRWNPNITSYTSIATATNSGLVRIQTVEGLVSKEVETAQQEAISQDV